jgi:hypothetical protein
MVVETITFIDQNEDFLHANDPETIDPFALTIHNFSFFRLPGR